jgi:uncharacterized protein YlxW (UPF0749 family)
VDRWIVQAGEKTMSIENIIGLAAVLVTLIGGFTALFTSIFGASKISVKQLQANFDELKAINVQLRADNMTLLEDNNKLRDENRTLSEKIIDLQNQIEKLKNSLEVALRTIEKLRGKRGEV